MDGGFNKAVVDQDTMDGTGHGRIEGRATNQRITVRCRVSTFVGATVMRHKF